MSGYLTKIKTKIPYSDKEVDINVDGKTLILTGGNGCGKTQLLNYLHEKLHDRIIKKDNKSLAQLESLKKHFEMAIMGGSPTDKSYEHQVKQLQDTVLKIEEAKQPSITLSDLEEFVLKHNNFEALLLLYEAGRKSDILRSSAVPSLNSLKEKDKLSVTSPHKMQTASSFFEEFLVTSIAGQAFSESKKINNDPLEAERIDKWFKKLEGDLQHLFEDEELRLVFQSDSFSFEIHQPHKEPYTFQSLSSGFSSIMAVYADLITKVSLRSIDPDDLTGIVLIDEIDAHLHVSIQKKILAFLKNSFPKVQFIVTTHSPFVVLSVDDAVIYDLSKLEQVDDLSMYSYESVLEGLFGVLPISSLLQQNIETLAKLLERYPIDIKTVQSLLDKLPEDESLLDSESLYFVNSAKLAINKAKR
ncbi:AAA family ATPase [Pseudoalteromonas piscicida]|uniref:AAA family ATPase n=1 Tax=Pseudoalteromonas piscicida TaxID=43662 RepID=UPI0030C9DCAB